MLNTFYTQCLDVTHKIRYSYTLNRTSYFPAHIPIPEEKNRINTRHKIIEKKNQIKDRGLYTGHHGNITHKTYNNPAIDEV